MKILAIVGSPRKKNTCETVRKIEAYHKAMADCEYEYLFLKDLDLRLCSGCHICITKGEEFCPWKDDRDMIIRKMEESDGVILASPTHSMNVSWLMKNFLDRLSFLAHRPKFFQQRFMLVAVSGSYRGGKATLEALSFGVFGGRVVGRLNVLNSPGMNDSKRMKQEAAIKKAARRFATEMQRAYMPRPTFGFMMWFCAFKALSTVYGKECAADHAFYKDKRYFTPCDLNLLQKGVLGGFTRLFTYMVQKGYV